MPVEKYVVILVFLLCQPWSTCVRLCCCIPTDLFSLWLWNENGNYKKLGREKKQPSENKAVWFASWCLLCLCTMKHPAKIGIPAEKHWKVCDHSKSADQTALIWSHVLTMTCCVFDQPAEENEIVLKVPFLENDTWKITAFGVVGHSCLPVMSIGKRSKKRRKSKAVRESWETKQEARLGPGAVSGL